MTELGNLKQGKNVTLDSKPSAKLVFCAFLKVNGCQWGGKQHYAVHGESPLKGFSPQLEDGVPRCPVLQDGLMEMFLKTGGGSSCARDSLRGWSISEYLWCESMVGQQNRQDSQLSPVDDKLSLSIQSVAGFLSDFEFFPLFIMKQKAKEFHMHQPQASWLESCCSLHYFSPSIAS